MILNSLLHHRKKTAWTLLFIFYADIVAAGRLQRNMRYASLKASYINLKATSNKQGIFAPDFLQEETSFNSNEITGAFEKGNGRKTAAKNLNVQIGGPGQPEMQGFQSVNANNMVDLFSGDFSYNVPLIDVGGYPLGISYRSGASMDQEASWVGLGWNINPGTIMRNVRGLPDDFNGTEKIVKQYNIRKNWTAGITAAARPEIFGLDIPKIGLNIGAFYNNYNGIGFELGASATANPGKYITSTKTTDEKTADTKVDSSFTTKFGGSLGFTLNSQNGLNINASMMMKFGNEDSKINGVGKIGANYNSRSGLQDLTLSAQNFNSKVFKNIKNTNASFDIADISFAKSTYTPTITIPFTSYGFSFTLKGGGALFGFHPLGALKGYYSSQFLAKDDRIDSLPAYGYMHFQKGNRDDRGLLDFNREKDIAFRTKTPHTAIPFYTYDAYSISGEGIGGTFRPYRGDVGYVRDHNVKTKNGSGGLGIDLGGAPNLAHFGGDLQFNYSVVSTGRWAAGNLMERNVRFTSADSTYEAVYFRNPSEQTSNTQEFYDKIGGDDVVRLGMAGDKMEPVATNQLKRYDKQKYRGAVNVSSPIVKDKRDKRSQVISYLSAAEAQKVGLDTFIKSYPINVFPKGKCDTNFESIPRNDGLTGIRKSNHISEITVLNNDGRRYVYGIPAYNLSQKEVTFAVKPYEGNTSTGLVSYNPSYPDYDNSIDNRNGKDNFYSSETTPAFAHSFLLSGVLSPDYSDITGDGITEDDNGDAVKFNYSRMKWVVGNTPTTAFKWRTPYNLNMASYNEGLKTDRSDDKGNYVYGEKEIWYMNSIESKTMIAIFILDNALRTDNISVNGENGGQDGSNYALRSLKQIKLYSKSDYFKNPSTARPIKTVNFAYSYKLCTGSPAAYGAGGKLTLDSLWFTYNGNNRSAKSKYRFTYNTNNPTYNNRNNDRWGGYKPSTDNPNSLPNGEYPYAVQDKTNADNNAGAWNLTQIKLPSGAKINAEYESDDYAYVQNKKAMNMYRVVAMGTNSTYSQARQLLYDNRDTTNIYDCQYIFIRVPSTVSNKNEVYRKYLEGVGKIYFRVSVKIPGSYGANAYEQIPFYGELIPDSFNLVNSNLIWVKLKEFGKTQCYPAIAALQFLRLNLPGKAYPGSDVINDDPGPAPAIQAILGMGKQFKEAIKGFNKAKRQSSVSQQFDSTRSFVRLTAPDYYKYGGGYRVKKIIISDNWTSMTGQRESYYGQEYDYSTTKQIFYESSGIIKTKTVKISSGVASYEPNVGNEENPFRQPIEYQESVTMAPTDYFYTEYPYCEALFPSPSVGYSKVTVSSINKRNLKSFNGWEETEFFTNYDFPTITDYTTFDGESKKTGKRKYSVINSLSLKRTTLSQGFKIELNDMCGKVKSQKSYAATDSIHPISYTNNYYRIQQDNVHGTYLSNTVPVIDSSNGKINPYGTVGKDIELMMDFREQQSLSTGVAVNFNAETMLFFIVPVVIPPFFPVTNIDDNRFRSAVTVKIIQRYGILDSVLHYEKGSLVSTQNMLYDAQTGDVILSRTQNEFNDPVYNFNYPAHWVYSGMEPAYRNISAVFENINVTGGKISSNGKYKSVDSYLESGDEILVDTPGIIAFDPYCGGLTQLSFRGSKAKKVWAVDINKTTGAAGRQLYLMDRFGNTFTGFGARIKIIRSGKRNTASASVGTITSLREPLDKTNSLEWKLKFDSTIGVIATGAGVYKDIWNVDNRFVSERRCDTIIRNDSIIGLNANLSAMKKYAYFSSGQPTVDQTFLYPDILVASYEYQHFRQTTALTNCRSRKRNCSGSTNSINYTTRAMLKFDYLLQNIPVGAVITEAKINLYSKIPVGLWAHSSATNSTNPDNCINYWTSSVAVAHDYFDRVNYPNSNASAGYNNVGFIKRITAPWDITTSMVNLNAIVSETNRASLSASKNNNSNYSISCTQLIQDYISNPSFGLMIMLANENNNGCNIDQTRHLSFDIGTHGVKVPALTVKYTYSSTYCRDTCISIFNRRINPYVQGIWGNWRMDKSYVFYDDRKETDPLANTDIRRNGEFKLFIPFWNIASPVLTQTNYAKWTWNSQITRFNKRGLEIENKDPLGRFNSGLYGYNQTLPVAVAQNAKYRQIAFEGFEDYKYKNDSCDQRCPPLRPFDFSFYINKIDSTEKHTGKASLKLNAFENVQMNIPVVSKSNDSLLGQVTAATSLAGVCGTKLDSVTTSGNILTPVFSPLQGDSVIVGLWVKEGFDCKSSSYTGNSINIIYTGSSGQIGPIVTLRPSGNIIEGWQRYEEMINIPSTANNIQLTLKNNSSNAVYFDDLRLHPFNSNMKTFVYNPINLRLMAELDENNYASFYEYDDEGTLTRVKKETQRGIKTIQETKSTLTKQ